jgi:hypothetical protein
VLTLLAWNPIQDVSGVHSFAPLLLLTSFAWNLIQEVSCVFLAW